jgi:hypothetical protein
VNQRLFTAHDKVELNRYTLLNRERGFLAVRTVLQPCIVAYLAVIVIELLIRRRWARFVLELIALLLMITIGLLINNAVTGRVAFGQGTSPIGTVGIMFAAIICGIAARYIFYMKGAKFSWLDFFKPITISPIVLLPLIGSIQNMGELNAMQVVSFAVLAFQNGFFWQAVLEGAKPSAQVPISDSCQEHS